MKKYVVLYYATSEAMNQAEKSTPEEKKEGMAKWHAWAERCGDKLVDLGAPLGNAQKIDTKGKSSCETCIVGYSVLQAETQEAAETMLEGHPHLGWHEGCSIELHEQLPMPDE